MSAHSQIEDVVTVMDPYAKPKERNIGARRPKIRHVSQSVEPRTRRERQAELPGFPEMMLSNAEGDPWGPPGAGTERRK